MDRTHLLEVPSINSIDRMVVADLVTVIEGKIEDGLPIDQELAEVHQFTNGQIKYDLSAFRDYWKSMSKEEFVTELLTPAPRIIPDLSEAEILIILTKMTQTDMDNSIYYLTLLAKNTTHTADFISNLVYWPNHLGYSLDLTLEAMAKILARTPSNTIILSLFIAH